MDTGIEKPILTDRETLWMLAKLHVAGRKDRRELTQHSMLMLQCRPTWQDVLTGAMMWYDEYEN